jgi:peptidoglycan-associated lipoprotein
MNRIALSLLFIGAAACSKTTDTPPAASPDQNQAAKDAAAKAERDRLAKENSTMNAAAKMDMPTNFNFTAVQFGYDSTDLDDAARAQLDQAAKWLSDNKTVHLTIAGHADDRGTQEYNLALGEKRAAAVRKYLSTMGVSQQRLATISFGELQPVANDQTEEAFAKNRRADFKVENKN